MTAEIVILNWNGLGHLQRFLPGVVAASPEGVGVTVADNGSTDGSVAWVARNFPAVRLIRFDRNYGFAEGYNRALELLDAELCVLLNSDVETPRGWLEPILREMKEHSDVAAAAPKLRSCTDPSSFEYAGAAGGYIDWLGYPFCRGRILQHLERDEGQYDDARDLFWVSGAAFCCRRDVFLQLGGFAPDFFAHMEEIDLCWRMQLAGYRVRIVPQSCVYHLGGGTLSCDSPRKIYYNHRNNLAMLFRCAPAGQRIAAALLRPLLDAAAAFSYLLQGRRKSFVSVWRAWRDFIRWHGRLAAQRRAIRGARRAESSCIYRGSIVLRYLAGRHTFGRMM